MAEIPPWLTRDYDPVGSYIKSYQVGAQIGEAQTRLAEQQRQANMEHAAKQQAMQANILKAQQEMLMEKAYKDQQLSLDSARLTEAQKKNQQEAQHAADVLEETKRRNTAAALQAAASLKEREIYHQGELRKKLTHFTPGGGVLQFDPESNKVEALREPAIPTKTVSPAQALSTVTDPARTAFIEGRLGKDSLADLVAIAKSGIPKSTADIVNASATAELPRVTTKAEYDDLPRGSRYIGKDSRIYQKP